MEFFPRHYSIPRDGQVTSIVVNNVHDLRRLRTELEILRRARRQVVFRCTPIGQAPDGMYSDDDQKELINILHDAEHPLVEEMIDHIDRAFPNTRKEIMMSVVNDEAQNIVQEAVEVGAIEESQQPTAATNEAAADAAIDMLAEAEAKLSALVEDSNPDAEVETDSATPDVDAEANPANEISSDDAAKAEAAEPVLEDEAQTSDEAVTEDSQAVDDMENAVEAITEAPVSEPAVESPVDEADNAQMNNDDAADNTANDAPAIDQAPEPTLDEQPEAQPEVTAADAVASTDNETTIETEADDSQAQEMSPEECVTGNSADEFVSETSPAEEAVMNASIPDVAPSDYGPERAQQAVEEIETGIRKLANVLNTQVKEQWTQASDALGDIVEKRTQLEQKLFDAKDMLEKLDRSRKEADISRDAADVARREAELFRDDLRKLRDEATKNQ